MVNKLLKKGYVFLDGAMGTMLQKNGIKIGELPEMLCLTDEDAIIDIHKQYIASGSNIIYTNTFGANARKLAYSGKSVEEIITKAVSIAKKAADKTDVLVALDIGPIGEMLEPSGTLSFDEAYEIFKQQVICGEKAGADLVVFETMTDLYEVKAAVLAAKENTKLPIFVTMTFEANKRTFTGCSVSAMAHTLEGLGIDAVGINCSLGPNEIYPIAKELCENTTLPVIIKANAGLPNLNSDKYDITASDFARSMEQYHKLGISIIGGCCGTTPEYIKCMKASFEGLTPVKREFTPKSVVCTPTKTVDINKITVIGERINPTGKKLFKEALLNNNIDYVLAQGVQQSGAGADILDVNVGIPNIDEPKMMAKVVKSLQSVLDLPLQIDSSDPAAIELGLRYYNGKAIVNSVNGEQEVLDKILPIVKKYGAAVVGLTLNAGGIPETAEQRFEIAEKILSEALKHGIKKEDVFIDCLTLTVSAQQDGAVQTLKAVKMVKEKLGLKTVLGVSNISFGLPNRELITSTFLTLALENGLDLPIVNPNSSEIMDEIFAFNVLHNNDVSCMKYIQRFANTVKEEKPHQVKTNDINFAIAKGLKDDVRHITFELLKEKTELEIINTILIPALDTVGVQFEKGEIFLPQLLNAAAASQVAFDIIKNEISKKGGAEISKGKIIIATVKGDIHDIGKNIVKVILENYGYQVIDLGKDVEISAVVTAAKESGAKLVGLSALMTTTLKSMEHTITALKNSGCDCKIFVGGAVLINDYAMQIGADYYAKDAKEAVDIAKKVLSEG